MEDSDELLLPVWRANLVLLTREVGAASRLARMMTFSASYLKLMLSGQREFSEEFVRGIEAVTGLPNGWMNTPHTEAEIPPNAREAIDNEQPLARFRGTAHPVRKKTCCGHLSRFSARRRLPDASKTKASTPKRIDARRIFARSVNSRCRRFGVSSGTSCMRRLNSRRCDREWKT